MIQVDACGNLQRAHHQQGHCAQQLSDSQGRKCPACNFKPIILSPWVCFLNSESRHFHVQRHPVRRRRPLPTGQSVYPRAVVEGRECRVSGGSGARDTPLCLLAFWTRPKGLSGNALRQHGDGDAHCQGNITCHMPRPLFNSAVVP